MKLPRSVQVVVYRESGDTREYLLLLRHRPGTEDFWQPVSGSLEPGESDVDAARREVAEETGMTDLDTLVEIGLVDRFEIAPAWRPLYEPGVAFNVQVAFAARTAGRSVRIDPAEHADFQWATYDEAVAAVRYAPNRRAIELVESGAARARRRRYDMDMSSGQLALGRSTLVMGVLNVTPDSFSDGGRYSDPGLAVERALAMEAEGAHIIDIGGESTRPGSDPASQDEELRRVEPVVRAAAKQLRVPISIDTMRSGTAQAALDAGAAIVNDVSGLRFDRQIAAVAGRFGAPLVLMHMRGTPRTMQQLPPAGNILEEVRETLLEALSIADAHGADATRIILDPGIGFGKSVEQNVELLARLDRLADLDRPLLVGTSLKSFLGALTGRDTADRLHATTASVAAAVLSGAHVVRVHDVAPAVDAARVADAVLAALGERVPRDYARAAR